MTNYEAAIDEMFAQFRIPWEANSAAVAGYVPEVRWPGVEEIDPPDASKYWARVSQQTVDEQQTTLRNGEFAKRYTADGLVFVQIFCPKSDAESMTTGRRLATIARNAFRGQSTSGNVWFRNARIKELEPEAKFYRFNVVTEYEYDEEA